MKDFLGLLSVVAGVAVADHASAFCGFYVSGADTKLFNNATQVVLMREGTRTALSMANNYEGPAANFAMVVPVPVVLQKDNVKTLPREIFAKVDQLDAPRLVEYWEQDPCAPQPDFDALSNNRPRKMAAAPRARAGGAPDLGVTVEAQFTVGEYEIVILSAKDASGLDTWLRQEKYQIPDGAEPYFRPYVQSGSKFFVARVDMSKVTVDQNGQAQLSPLRFHYDTDQFSLPVRLGLINSKGTQDLIVHILAKGQRYEVANYPNATIPTNLDVSETARDKFGSFYAALFDKTLEKTPNAVVTEYAWDAGTCDPCPGPALYGDDLATLGADVMPPPADAPHTASSVRRGRNLGFMPTGYTITRLHARYTKDALGEDLVFRAAPAITGGREVRTVNADNSMPTLEHGATPTGGTNNFQGRYAIRHPWGGEITCKNPQYGIWGGPPASAYKDGVAPDAKPKPAKDLAFVARDVPLASFVRSDISELGIKADGSPVTAVIPPHVDGGATPASTAPIGDAGTGDAGTSAPVQKSGCGACAVGTSRGETPATAGLAIAGVLALLTRRRGRKTRAIPRE